VNKGSDQKSQASASDHQLGATHRVTALSWARGGFGKKSACLMQRLEKDSGSFIAVGLGVKNMQKDTH